MAGCDSCPAWSGPGGGACGWLFALTEEELVILLLNDTVLSTSMHSTFTVVVVVSTLFFPRLGDFSLSDLMRAAVTLTLWVTKVSVKFAVVNPFFSAASSFNTRVAAAPLRSGFSVACFSDLLRLLGTLERTASLTAGLGSLSLVRVTSLEPPPLLLLLLLLLFSRSFSSFLA